MNRAAGYDDKQCKEPTEPKGLDAAMGAIVLVAAAAAAVAMLSAAAVAIAVMPSAAVAAVAAVLAMATIVAIPAAVVAVVAAVPPMFVPAQKGAPTETVDAIKEKKSTGRRYRHARPHEAIHRRSVATTGGYNGNLPPWIP